MILNTSKYGKKFFLPVFFVISILLTACKKNDVVPDEIQHKGTDKLLADSIFLYANQVYLWNEQLPSLKDFNPGRYISSEGKLNYKTELFDISQLTINPQSGKPYEWNRWIPAIPKYSAIFTATDQESETDAGMLNVSGRFGISLVVVKDQDLYINYVIKGSDAEKAGVKRGMRITSINGNPVKISASYYKMIMQSFNEGSQLELVCMDHQVTRQYKFIYKKNNYFEPILKDTILPLPSGRKAGYLAYLKFIDVRHVYQDLDRVIGGFAANGVSDVIVDLRYNGGGNLTELDRFANLLVPFPADGKVMRKEQYNNLVKSGQATLLSLQPIIAADGLPVYQNGKAITYGDVDYTEERNTVYYNKMGGIGTLKGVCFIVSEKTASAAELLISCLQPYLKIKIVGVSGGTENSNTVKTYGKPVGFFPLKIGNMSVYYSMFRNINANGKGDYYDGIPAEVSVYDDPQFDFGTRGERGLEAALSLISGDGERRVKTERLGSNTASWKELPLNKNELPVLKSSITLKDGTKISLDR